MESAYSARSFENARKAREDLFGDQNNRKRYDGYLAGLLDPQIWSALEAREGKLRDAIGRDAKFKSTLSAYDRIKRAQAEIAKNAPVYNYLEQERPVTVGYRGPRAFSGDLFKYARLLLRAADERAKPNGERIPTFRDSARESLELELFSNEPIYDDYEILRLTDSLTDFASAFGADNPLVKKVLAGKSPHARAVELVSGTKLKDAAVRKDLYSKDAAALQAAHDPMIDLARMIDAQAREARKIYSAQDEIKKQAYADIAKARFAIEGASSYPDATFTLRLSYGTVRGYEQDGKQIPAFTDFAGLYQRAAEHVFNRREVLGLAYGARSFENARKARDDLFGDQNNRKRYNGYLAGLLDPQIWSALQAREQKLRDAIAHDSKLRSTIAAYDRIKRAQAEIAKNAPLYNYLEQERPSPVGYRGPRALFGNLFKYARLLVRALDERAKPNGERIPQFRDSARDSLELELFSTEPIYDDYEILRLTDSLTDFASQFGADNPLVKKVLAGKSPHDRAVELVSGTKLKDVAVRKDLYGRDAAALQAAHDPMIDLARLVDGPAREAKKIYDTQDEIKKQAYSEIAKARFATEGTGSYPDATFTLRLSYGTVRGYEQDGKQIPAFTDFAGLYQRSAEHDNRPPFDLPKRWIDKKASLNLATHFNFVSDPDIIGGNSGSPVVNKANEFVGIIFDGNIQSLVLDCIYTDTQSRAVSVDSAAITEALRKVYDAGPLVDELLSGK